MRSRRPPLHDRERVAVRDLLVERDDQVVRERPARKEDLVPAWRSME